MIMTSGNQRFDDAVWACLEDFTNKDRAGMLTHLPVLLRELGDTRVPPEDEEAKRLAIRDLRAMADEISKGGQL